MTRRSNAFHSWRLMWVQLAVFAQLARAGDDAGDEFSNNLFSDLAPLLALFGEQVAKQYLSQSLSWLDAIIFAMAPLGIITAIVSAIRIGGPRWLRAVIGRARESKGSAELELMSSTSADVCELWSGETIVRTLGSPYIAEILWLEKIDKVDDADKLSDGGYGEDEGDALVPDKKWDSDGLSGTGAQPGQVFGLADAHKSRLIKGRGVDEGVDAAKARTPVQLLVDHVYELEGNTILKDNPAAARRRNDEETEASIPDALLSPPNLSLNVNGDLTSKSELVFVALLSTVLQVGVVVYQIMITYLRPFNQGFLKGGNRIPEYACPLTVAGTVMVGFGMFACSMVVQEKSEERTWDFDHDNIPPGYRLRVAWLQRHQVVTDQNFGGFCLYAPSNRTQIMESVFHSNFKSQNLWTIVGTSISVVGFVLQFTGLRGMHYSATLAQLGAILVVTLLRIMIRRQLGTRPILDSIPDGRELDWMAKKVTDNDKWTIIPFNPTNPPSYGESDTLIARRKLRHICPWPLENSNFASKAESLGQAIEELTNYIYFHAAKPDGIKLKYGLAAQSSFTFSVPITYSNTFSKSRGFTEKSISIEVHRGTTASPRAETWGGWKVDRYMLEAMLTLWELSIEDEDKQPDTGYNDRSQSLILLGSSSEFNLLDFDIFIGNSSRCRQMQNGMNDLGTHEFPISKHRVFGYIGTDLEEGHLALPSFTNISDLCARHILTCYFYRVCQFIEKLNGQTIAFHGYDATITDPLSIFRMTNSHLDGMVDTLYTAGTIGSREELLTIFVPALQKNGNLLRVFDAFSKLIQDTHDAETKGLQPMFSQETLFRMTEQALRQFRNRGHWLHAGDFTFGLLGTCQNILGETHEWTKTARTLVSRVCSTIEAQITCQLALDFHRGSRPHIPPDVCLNLALQCENVLGKESPEWAILWRIYLETKFAEREAQSYHASGLNDNVQLIFELPGDTTGHGPVVSLSQGAINIPSTSSNAPKDENFNISDVIKSLYPNHDISFIKEFPAKVWELLRVQDLKALHYELFPPDPESPEGATTQTADPHSIYHTLISDTLIIATVCGLAGVVELCLRKFPTAYSYSAIGVRSTIGEAAALAAMNNDCTVLDLIVSVLDRDEMIFLEQSGFSGLNCLQIACRDGYVGVARILLRAGINPNYLQNDDFRLLPINLAACANHTDIILLLFSYGVAPMSQTIYGRTFVHYAAEYNSELTIDFVLAPESNLLHLVFLHDDYGECPLHLAIANGHKSLALCLLKAMAAQTDQYLWESNSHGIQGFKYRSVLILACKHGHSEIVKLLVSRGMNPALIDEDTGDPVLKISISQGDSDVGQALIEKDEALAVSKFHGDTQFPIHMAVRSNKASYINLLLEHGASIDTIEEETGYTPLLMAAGLDNLELFQLLRAKKASINAKDNTGRTLVHIAATAASVEVLGAFIECPEYLSSPDILKLVDGDGHTPLELALIHGHLQFAKMLLTEIFRLVRSGLTDFLTAINGSNCLHLICTSLTFEVGARGDPELKPFLKRYVKDIEQLPEPPTGRRENYSRFLDGDWADRETIAVEIIQDILQENVTNGKELDSNGRAPLFYAAAAGSAQICKLLVQHMDVSTDKLQIQDALQVAIYGADIPVIKEIVRSGIDMNGPLRKSFRTPTAQLLHMTINNRRKESTGYTVSFGHPTEDPWESDVDVSACLQVFIDAGADLTPNSDEIVWEQTLLHLAVMCKSPDVIDVLVNGGADINLPSKLNCGRTLLHFALSEVSSNSILIPTICRHGVDINSLDRYGRTALAIEISKKNSTTINALLENGALLHPGSSDKDLLVALRSGDSSYILFKILCERYKKLARSDEEYAAFLNAPLGPDGCGPVHLAAEYQHEDILEFLYKEGANMNAKDNLGRNVLSYAFDKPSMIPILFDDYGVNPNETDLMGYTPAHLAVTSLDNIGNIIRVLGALVICGANNRMKDHNGKTPSDHVDELVWTGRWIGDPHTNRAMIRAVLD
ncbi:hypothetical protein TWF730_009099 [Orbilia blumenaviensis]|uniref:Uncharacterized protein n=1 Tax=Orbilia blumenaviensis TaxID=1796055 RepID=A0AAV9UYS2_9PEZI